MRYVRDPDDSPLSSSWRVVPNPAVSKAGLTLPQRSKFCSGQIYEAVAREAYGLNYDRLVALKNRYDPTNFFRMNHNIRPT